ncbi:hypothetical protein H696_03988 [Fonticula alba]|uniref:Uncharacterized protein n=1 Tax=Fonticula alba TaxID=691883 RepID=A0A058Z633_FONAL|nr:hypothetical protein H696_03988 [Fonticula alba]KCV69566.1 hypothetical protein H696_03988 [Fonticula alba]|eukprot:XP_009496131.1 hypothetical protein H696_03988 [Fonticula alba]
MRVSSAAGGSRACLLRAGSSRLAGPGGGAILLILYSRAAAFGAGASAAPGPSCWRLPGFSGAGPPRRRCDQSSGPGSAPVAGPDSGGMRPCRRRHPAPAPGPPSRLARPPQAAGQYPAHAPAHYHLSAAAPHQPQHTQHQHQSQVPFGNHDPRPVGLRPGGAADTRRGYLTPHRRMARGLGKLGPRQH